MTTRDQQRRTQGTRTIHVYYRDQVRVPAEVSGDKVLVTGNGDLLISTHDGELLFGVGANTWRTFRVVDKES